MIDCEGVLRSGQWDNTSQVINDSVTKGCVLGHALSCLSKSYLLVQCGMRSGLFESIQSEDPHNRLS